MADRRTGRPRRISREERRKKEHRERRLLFRSMQQKLILFFWLVMAALIGLGCRVIYLNREKGTEYSKQVLAQQRYDSRQLPYKRGEILDVNGTKLAYSEKVYNLILDANAITESRKENALTETMGALGRCFDINTAELTGYVNDNPNSQYYVVAKRLPYDQVAPFLAEKEENASITGVWFEEEYKRQYPNQTLASSVIGFTGTDNNGTYGLEEYYNSTLNGSNGREYGYLSEESMLERTTIPAQDGNTLVTSIDVNLQSIIEKYMNKFAESHRGEYREGEDGVKNMGVIMMNPKTGEIMAMADYPNFDLNNPKDLTPYLSAEEISAMDDKATYDYLNNLWRNFCISDTYEPGSVAKALTIAAGLDSGKLAGTETFFCGGKLTVSGHEIKCHNHSGHGMVDLSGALEKSCNVALMQIGEQEGKETLMKYLYNFNIGLKTNIDLSGEARTNTLVYKVENMVASDLAISTFGQGYNVTMIQMASAFCSVINGGKYYEPHVVTEIRDSMGTTIKKIEPRILKQTISATTSDTMREYLTNVCIKGTGTTAVPAGYEIGGKTGTAEKQPRGTGNYVMSFMGFAPADDPQVLVYCVIDEPNVADQPHSTFAQEVVKEILTEALPYLHIYRTRELTPEEEEELEALNLLSASRNEASQDTGDAETEGAEQGEAAESTQEEGEEQKEENPYEIDPQTGYAIDPENGELLNPDDFSPVDPTSSNLDGLIGVENDPSQTTDPQDAHGYGASGAGQSETDSPDTTRSDGIGAGSAIGDDSINIQYNPDSLRGGNSENSDFGAGAGF